MRRRRQRPLGGRILLAVFPLGRRRVLTQSMLSAVGDAIEAREGTLVTDAPGGGDLAGGSWLTINTIRLGDLEQVKEAQIAAAERLGYELDERPHARVINRPDALVSRFLRVHWLPTLAFTTVPPGEHVDGFSVPKGSVGVRLTLHAGATGFENGQTLRTRLNKATSDYLQQHGVNYCPPPPWQRYWSWWWTRHLVRAQLSTATRRIEGFRGSTVVRWFSGAEGVGPYTLGVAAIQQGDPHRMLAAIEDMRSNQVVSKDLSVGLTMYNADDEIGPTYPSVPEGSSGLILSVTRRRA